MSAEANGAPRPIGALSRVLREEGWVRQVLGCVVMSCIVATVTGFVQERFQATIDAVAQGYALARLQPEARRCDPLLETCISLLSIDEEEYRSVFGQRSPLDPAKLTELLSRLAAAPPKVLAIDLDLAPASDDDWAQRAPLRDALLALSERTKLVMVCPQGYSLRDPSALDRQWTRSFVGKEVRFARAELDAEGLYYDAGAMPLGLVAANAAELLRQPGSEGPTSTSTDWDVWCGQAPVPAAAAQSGGEVKKSRKIRPSWLPVVGYTDAGKDPELLRGHVVIFGGQYGISDRFFLHGAPDGIYGLTLHGWVAAGALASATEVPKSAEVALDVVIGLAAGFVLHGIWTTMRRHRQSFFWRSLLQLAFLGVAVGLPVLLLGLAVTGVLFGLFAGAAGMVISVTADSLFSPQEALLEDDVESDPATSAAQALPWVERLPLAAATMTPGLLGAAAVWALLLCGETAKDAAAIGLVVAVMLWIVSLWRATLPALRPVQRPKVCVCLELKPYKETRKDGAARLLWRCAQVGFVAWTFHRPEFWPALALVVAFLLTLALLDHLTDRLGWPPSRAHA